MREPAARQVGSDDARLTSALLTIENTIRDHAAAAGFPAVPEAQMREMLAYARTSLMAMPAARLQMVAASPHALAQLAATGFNAVATDRDRAALRSHGEDRAAPDTRAAGGAHGSPLAAFRAFHRADRSGDPDSLRDPSRRADYGPIAGDYDPQKGLASLTQHNFARSPFAAAGLDYSFTRQLAQQGFSTQHIIAAAHDVKALGFSPKDKEAVKDSAIIRKFDNKPDETNKALLNYKHCLEQDEELRKLAEERKRTTDAQRKKEIDHEIRQKFEAHSHESGLHGRMTDPHNRPPAKAAIRRHKERVERHYQAATAQAAHKVQLAAAAKPATQAKEQQVAAKEQKADDALAALNSPPPASSPGKPSSPAKGPTFSG